MLTARPETTSDVAAIRAVNVASFPTPAEAQLVDLLRDAGHLTVSLVADLDGEVVGHVAFSPVSTASGAAGLGLAPVAVLPAHRCRGIAARLVEEGIEAARRLGYGWLVVLGDPAYYGRFGFEPAAVFGLSDAYGGGDAFQALEIGEGSLPRGAGLVTYAPEFDSLEQAAIADVDALGDLRIETARLVLAPLEESDAARVLAYRADPGVCRFQFFEPTSLEDARRFILDSGSEACGWHQLGIRLRDGGTLVGDLGVRPTRDEPPQAEIGVTVAPEHQRRSIGLEALGGLLDHLFRVRHVHRVFASVDPRNAASVALLTRIGFRREAHFRESILFKGEWADDLVFGLLRSEWLERTA